MKDDCFPDQFYPALTRLPIVGVMGSGVWAHEELAAPLGRRLAGLDVHLLTGGGRGVMESVSRAFASVEDRAGLVIGVLPLFGADAGEEADPGYPNRWVEILVRTHLGREGASPDSRNHVNVLTSDVVVALPGSAGTASEVALSVRYRRPVILFGDLERARGLPPEVATAETVDDVIAFVRERVRSGASAAGGRAAAGGHGGGTGSARADEDTGSAAG